MIIKVCRHHSATASLRRVITLSLRHLWGYLSWVHYLLANRKYENSADQMDNTTKEKSKCRSKFESDSILPAFIYLFIYSCCHINLSLEFDCFYAGKNRIELCSYCAIILNISQTLYCKP